MSPQDRANAGSLSEAAALPTGFTQEGSSIVCPSGLRWSLNQGNGFDLNLRGNTIHVPYDEFKVIDQYVMHSGLIETGTMPAVGKATTP